MVTARVRPKKVDDKPEEEKAEDAPEQEPESPKDEPKYSIKITDLDEVDEALNMLIYGPPGVGKTVLAASARDVAELAPVLLVDFEGGTRSILDRKGIRFIRIKKWKELLELMKMLRDPVLQKQFKTIIIDPVNEMQKMIMANVIAEAVVKDQTHDREVPYQADWGRNAERTRKIIKIFRDGPFNVIFTCLSKEQRDETDGSTTFKPALPGQLSDEIGAAIDIVGFLRTTSARSSDDPRKRQVVRRIAFQSTGKFTSKDRTWKLGGYITNPSMRKIWDKIQQTGDLPKMNDDEEDDAIEEAAGTDEESTPVTTEVKTTDEELDALSSTEGDTN